MSMFFGQQKIVRNRIVFILGCGFLSGVLVSVLSACGEKSTAVVLAKVSNETITNQDVDFAIERSFDRSQLTTVDASLQQKILDSLIASRAMKQLVVKDMSQEEITKIKNLAKAYEEELYVKAYLQQHTTPEPVSAEMVQDYYTKHPEEFGAEAVQDFELLKASSQTSGKQDKEQAEKQRDALLKNVGDIRAAKNWSAMALAWQKEFGVQYQQGRNKAGLLHPMLEQKIRSMKQPDTSDVFYIDGEFYLLRVTQITQTAPKSLAEVSGDIRKRLAPLMLREAVKKASEEARSKTKVELMAAPNALAQK